MTISFLYSYNHLFCLVDSKICRCIVIFNQQALNRTGFVVGILVGILTLFILYLWTRKKSSRSAVLIAGPCDVGKTVLFSRLVNGVAGKAVDTFTSMQENLGHFSLSSGRKVTVVDMPGHDRIRQVVVQACHD